MSKAGEKRVYRQIDGVERVEYPCRCEQGFYHYDPNGERIAVHNQLAHKCTHCDHVTFFTIPYPALRYKGRIFVDWETIRGQTVK